MFDIKHNKAQINNPKKNMINLNNKAKVFNLDMIPNIKLMRKMIKD